MHPALTELLQRMPELESAGEDIERAATLLCECFSEGCKLLLCGNGGSAADAEHIAGELMKGFHNMRALPDNDREHLGEGLAERLQDALPAIPLTGFTALATAYANDVMPEYVFAQLAWGLGRPGDALLAISTSGNSSNVLYALRAARARRMHTIGLTGITGGRMRELCDVCIRVPADRVDRIQEYHLPVYHCLCTMIEDNFFGA